jgi:superfamily I DNA/RNA helicase
MNTVDQPDTHEAARRRRQEHVDAVLASDARKKIVVGGPGTGKTFLFRNVLDGKSNTLTLTFVNALVEELSLDLFGLSKVRTLHAFARQEFERVTGRNVRVFPKLSALIRQDSLALRGTDVDFDALFHKNAAHDDNIEFYKRRRVYYGYYGFSDMIYGAVRFFEEHRSKIPQYTQVVVDEFQDFNAQEVALIELLASKSPVLLAGDDDQALYETLKCASPDHIRQRRADAASGYQTFSLPYCSRSTRVIVEAANDIIRRAKKRGCLKGRIEKPFRYFDDQEKDRESERYPSLIYGQVYPAQIPWFIQQHIQEIAKEVRRQFSVLVISPTKSQCKRIAEALRQKGFENVHYAEKEESREPTLLEGLDLLLQDGDSNLGWRVTARALLPGKEFEGLLKQTAKDDTPPRLCEIVPNALKEKVRPLLRLLRAARDGKPAGDDECVLKALKELGVDAAGIAVQSLSEQLTPSEQRSVDAAVRKISITVTTIPGSKGLAADYVFIAHFDDRYFIKATKKSHVTDQDICNFLVALTRARTQVFLISYAGGKGPRFLGWVDKNRVRTA